MKKYIFSIIAILVVHTSFGQNVKASIGLASNPSNVKIYLRPDITSASAVFSTLQFTVALPASITPIPTLSVVSTAFAAAAPAAWTVETPYIENGYIVYPIFTGASPTLAITANTEFQAMEVSFSGGPAGTFANSAHLICLPDGGAGGSGSAFFFCSGTVNTDGSNLFYSRDPSVVISNGFSYKVTTPNDPNRPAGTFTSFARLISGITLPVKFASFFASKQNNDALLNWTVENQNNLVKHFEIERSLDGSTFTKIAQKNPVFTAGTSANYDLTDASVFDNYRGTVYYRIKQVDLTGAITYSAIRSLKADSKSFAVSIYPNPAIEKANLVFSLDKAQPVTITLLDVLGKRITDYSMQAQKGINQKQIDVSALAAGTYNFSIKINDDTQTLSFVKSN